MNQNAIKELGITRFDAADYLKTNEDIALYFQACLDEGGNDPAFIAKSLDTIIKVINALGIKLHATA